MPKTKAGVKETSVTRKPRSDLSKDRKSAVPGQNTQSKVQTTVSNSKEATKSTERTTAGNKPVVKKSSTPVIHGKQPENKSNRSVRDNLKKNSRTEMIYLKDALARRGTSSENLRKAAEMRKTSKHEKPEIESSTKTEGDQSKVKRDRTRTRTLSPTEVKQLIQYKMAGGDQKIEKTIPTEQEQETSETSSEEENYEDDFEDYESDFEEDDSESSKSSEKRNSEHKSSESDVSQEVQESDGNEAVKEGSPQPTENHRKPSEPAWKSNLQKRQIEEIKRSIEKENVEVEEKRYSATRSTDAAEESKPAGDGRFLDFSMAEKRQRQEKEWEAAKKRGRDLLSMITLDAITYAILEIPPIPYECYMKTFGKTNTKQIHVQTNEDDLEEEIQTDEITKCNKWTQNPPEYLGNRKTDGVANHVLTKEERLGVGGDRPPEEDNQPFGKEIVVQTKTNGLVNFLSWSSQMVLAELEKKSGMFLNLERMPNQSKEVAFSDGFVRLSVDEIAGLKGRSVTCLCLPGRTCRKLLTVHLQKNKHFQRSFLCVWSLQELSKPLKILVASNRLTSCCFGPNQGNLVFAGLSDGSVCLWDLRESTAFHSQLMDDSNGWILQSPTYTTAGTENNHNSTIVSINLVDRSERQGGIQDFTPLQVCSLDKNGTVTIWSVIQLTKAQRNEPSDDLGLAHWGRLKLVKSSFFSVFDNARDEFPGLYTTCNDMLINQSEDDGFYVANSFGNIHHCSTYGSSMKPKYYVPSKQHEVTETTCLEMCPFNGNYFLAGCRDGTIRLHCRHQSNPLITLNSHADGETAASVLSITWITTRPCVFFVLDARSRIHIWDLAVSDMFPDMSLELTKKKITCMKLLAPSGSKQVPFIVIGTEHGDLEVHRLKKNYGFRSPSEVRSEKKMFLKYVSIL
ncbi:hypothetical protein RUM43_007663 [Polyplax serrata]|uniref:WD repeat-containing protein 60 n=1 Tax=Polyplax serrata TaxID=468196 RepID=A0AAN8S5N7_POLSC